jgi:tight adherence protein B
MPGYLLFFIAGMSLLSFVDFIGSRESSSPIERRKRQSKNMFSENVLRERLEKTIENRVKLSRRLKVEEKLQKAGLKMDFVDYMLLCLVSSVVFAIIFGSAMSNPLLAVIFLVIGYFVPGQAIEFIKNRRTALMEKQIGSFMQMVTKRYENTKDFHKAMALTVPEFEGEEPIFSELQRTLAEMNLGSPTEDALGGFAKRSNNKFMARYAAYYKVVAEIGKDEIRRDLLSQAIRQYQEDYELKRLLKKEISGPVTEAYIMVAAVPLIAIYQTLTNDQYIYFMTQTSMGRIGTAGILTTLLLIVWFINAKLGAPLD